MNIETFHQPIVVVDGCQWDLSNLAVDAPEVEGGFSNHDRVESAFRDSLDSLSQIDLAALLDAPIEDRPEIKYPRISDLPKCLNVDDIFDKLKASKKTRSSFGRLANPQLARLTATGGTPESLKDEKHKAMSSIRSRMSSFSQHSSDNGSGSGYNHLRIREAAPEMYDIGDDDCRSRHSSNYPLDPFSRMQEYRLRESGSRFDDSYPSRSTSRSETQYPGATFERHSDRRRNDYDRDYFDDYDNSRRSKFYPPPPSSQNEKYDDYFRYYEDDCYFEQDFRKDEYTYEKPRRPELGYYRDTALSSSRHQEYPTGGRSSSYDRNYGNDSFDDYGRRDGGAIRLAPANHSPSSPSSVCNSRRNHGDCPPTMPRRSGSLVSQEPAPYFKDEEKEMYRDRYDSRRHNDYDYGKGRGLVRPSQPGCHRLSGPPPRKGSYKDDGRHHRSQYIEDSQDEDLVEVSPGHFVPLRGSQETWQAVQLGCIQTTSCFVCTARLVCISDAELVMCPTCRNISPVDGAIGGGGLGLGMREDDATRELSVLRERQRVC